FLSLDAAGDLLAILSGWTSLSLVTTLLRRYVQKPSRSSQKRESTDSMLTWIRSLMNGGNSLAGTSDFVSPVPGPIPIGGRFGPGPIGGFDGSIGVTLLGSMTRAWPCRAWNNSLAFMPLRPDLLSCLSSQ